MKTNLKSIIFFLVIFTATDLSAKVFIEPHGAFILTGSSSAPGASKYSGPAYGAKLGFYQKEFGFNYGLDFTHSTYTYSTQNSSSAEYSRNEIGGFLGYNSQNQYRVWGGVYYTKTGLTGNDYYSGHTFEIGAGYAVSQKVSLNAYYRLPTYTKSSFSGIKQTISPAESSSEMALGVSFPLEM